MPDKRHSLALQVKGWAWAQLPPRRAWTLRDKLEIVKQQETSNCFKTISLTACRRYLSARIPLEVNDAWRTFLKMNVICTLNTLGRSIPRWYVCSSIVSINKYVNYPVGARRILSWFSQAMTRSRNGLTVRGMVGLTWQDTVFNLCLFWVADVVWSSDM